MHMCNKGSAFKAARSVTQRATCWGHKFGRSHRPLCPAAEHTVSCSFQMRLRELQAYVEPGLGWLSAGAAEIAFRLIGSLC